MTEQATAPEAFEAEKVVVTLQDISACVQVIDVVSQRGAIRGNELQAVGTLREKLVAFLKEAQAAGNPVTLPPEEQAAGDAEAAAEEAAA